MSKIKIAKSTILVTGTNHKKGIGRALVKEAITRGAKKVYATTRDNISQLNDLSSQYPEIEFGCD